MSEPLSPAELEVGRKIWVLADAGTRLRDPNAVVRAVVARTETRRHVWLPLAAVVSILVVLVVAVVAVVGLTNQAGSRAAAARVNGVSYEVSITRSIDLSGAYLKPFADATQDSGLLTENAVAYQVDDVDPRQVLVMKLAPGQYDDGGSIGSYLVLVRGSGFSLLCHYFAAGDPLAPTVCP